MLKLRDLHRRYGATVALDGLSFTVGAGEMFGFLGPNGAGKTTAMRIVMGVARPDVGTVRWRGAPVDVASRRHFGYMPEARGLYPKMRVRPQLVYFAELHGVDRAEARARADRWLARLGLAERGDARVDELSHGNQQRAQLAAALVHDPELLLLDEPFSGLDPLGVDAMSEVLRERAADGCAVVFSSHQLDLVEDLCETVAIVNRGRVVLAGPVDDLRARGRKRLEVGVAGAPPDWVPRIAGIRVLDARDGIATVELPDPEAERDVLDAALAAGRLTRFAEVRPSLSELFREAVAAS